MELLLPLGLFFAAGLWFGFFLWYDGKEYASLQRDRDDQWNRRVVAEKNLLLVEEWLKKYPLKEKK